MGYVWKERTQERRQAVLTGEKKKKLRRRPYMKPEVKKK